MSIQKISLQCGLLTLYLEKDSGIAFHHAKQTIYQLSPLVISLLMALDEYQSRRIAIEQVASITQLSSKDLQLALALIDQMYESTQDISSYRQGEYPEVRLPVVNLPTIELSKCYRYQVLDTCFALYVSEPALKEAILLTVPMDELASTKADVIFCVDKLNSGNFQIICNGLVIEEEVQFKQVLPHIIDRMQIIGYQRTDYSFCFHGGALQSHQQYFILPGVSGAGKSTLTALLASRQCAVLSDEMVVFDNQFNLLPLPLPIALKEGSWRILTNEYPSIEQAVIWQRQDGRLLKYVWPKQFAKKNMHKERYQLIFPCYKTGFSESAAKEQRLSVIDSLVLLVTSGYQVGNELSVQKIDQLIQFLSKITRVRLDYGTSEQALCYFEHGK